MRWTLLLTALAFLSLPALGHEGQARSVEIVEVSGVIDTRLAEFIIQRIEDAGVEVEVLILQVDSPGVVADAAVFSRLISLVSDPPIPVVSWVGPAPAVAYGGALQLALAAPLTAAAPGVEVGHGLPTIAGSSAPASLVDIPEDLVASTVTVGDEKGVLFGSEAPGPRQLIQDLNGREVLVQGERITLVTVQPVVGDDGATGVTNLPTAFHEPDLLTSFLRLGTRPEAAFFFLVAALTIAVFEFYAIGPGLAAAAAAVALIPAGYGLAVLPVRWWAFGIIVVSIAGLTASYQRGGVFTLGVAAVGGLIVGGLFLTDGSPQMVPSIGGVLLTVAGAAFFFFLAMPTVARSRFSTQTIDRRGLIGRVGVALSDLDPLGEVEVDGARWTARGHRGATIRTGQTIEVSGIDGTRLDVVPAQSAKT